MATQDLEICKCDVCGIIVEVLQGGAGEPVCCGQPMRRIRTDAAHGEADLHVPLVERRGGELLVRVGRQGHPMEPRHRILWIDLTRGRSVCRRFLGREDPPEVRLAAPDGQAVARAYCSVHGLWKGQPA
jgi:superoxide reductase